MLVLALLFVGAVVALPSSSPYSEKVARAISMVSDPITTSVGGGRRGAGTVVIIVVGVMGTCGSSGGGSKRGSSIGAFCSSGSVSGNVSGSGNGNVGISVSSDQWYFIPLVPLPLSAAEIIL